MNHLIANFATQNRAECPVCRQKLSGYAVTWVNGVAICRDCADSPLQDIVNHCLHAVNHQEMQCHMATAHGLRFFAPGRWAAGKLPAHLLLDMILSHHHEYE